MLTEKIFEGCGVEVLLGSITKPNRPYEKKFMMINSPSKGVEWFGRIDAIKSLSFVNNNHNYTIKLNTIGKVVKLHMNTFEEGYVNDFKKLFEILKKVMVDFELRQ